MTIKTELTLDELKVIIQALDSYVRANGLQVASNATIVHQKLQAAAKAAQPLENADA